MNLPDEERDRIARAYGAAVPPTARIERVPVGASGLPQMVWRPTGPIGGQIVYAEGGKDLLRRHNDLSYKRIALSRPQVKAAQARRATLKAMIEARETREAIMAAIGYKDSQLYYNDLRKLGLQCDAVQGGRPPRRAA